MKFRVALPIFLLLLGASLLPAAVVLDFNAIPPNTIDPASTCCIGDHTIGWAFTLANLGFGGPSLTINNVQTYFSSISGWNDHGTHLVTEEIYQGIPVQGSAVLLRSASFVPLGAAYSGPAGFAPLTLIAGTTYFIGFANVDAIGANNVVSPPGTKLTLYFQGFPDDNKGTGCTPNIPHCYNQHFDDTAPVLRFFGDTAVPEPSTWTLIGAGALMLLFRKRVA